MYHWHCNSPEIIFYSFSVYFSVPFPDNFLNWRSIKSKVCQNAAFGRNVYSAIECVSHLCPFILISCCHNEKKIKSFANVSVHPTA